MRDETADLDLARDSETHQAETVFSFEIKIWIFQAGSRRGETLNDLADKLSATSSANGAGRRSRSGLGQV